MSNSISIVGRLGKDAERKPVGENHVMEFSLACDTGYGDKKNTTWFRVAYWQKSDKLVDMLTKGTQVWVAGECSLREYTAKDGATKSSLDVRANVIQLVGAKQDHLSPTPDGNGEMPF